MNLTSSTRRRKKINFRNSSILRGQFLALAGYSIVTIETFIAIRLGITPITQGETVVLASLVTGSSISIIIAIYIKKHISPLLEWSMFVICMLFYLAAYCYWIYRLQQLRILGLLNALTAVTVVLTYTKMLQSILMSLSTLVCHFTVIYYAIVIKLQPGIFGNELFLSLCLIPAFFLVSVASYYVNKKRKQTRSIKVELEDTNRILNEANAMLRFEQTRTTLELDIAHDIQRSFFPVTPPRDDNWDAAFISVPTAGVSGDFYDFYCSGGRLNGVSLFDVSGHGVAPALITILARPVFYRNFNKFTDYNLGKVMEFSNSDLLAHLEEIHSFITGIVLRFRGNEVEYVNAGHPDLLCRRASSGEVVQIKDADKKFKGHPIGISSNDISYRTVGFTVESGDILILYSDCLLECRNSEGIYYGDEKIYHSIASAEGETAGEIMKSILNDFYAFAGETGIHDDMTLMVLKKK